MEDLLDPDEMLDLEVMIDQFDAQTDALCSAIMELSEEWPEYDPAMPAAPLEMERQLSVTVLMGCEHRF